jgi:hypothetical protein
MNVPASSVSSRFSRPARRIAGGMLAGVLALMGCPPPAAAIPVDIEYDFSTGPSGWTSLNTSADGFSYPRKWTWGAGTWAVDPTPVLSSSFWVANTLTSPQILVDPQSDALQLTVVHRFNFPENHKTGDPVVAGQLVYRFGESTSTFLPLSLSEFATGPIDPLYDSKTPYPDWVPPTKTAPVSLEPPLVASGGIWQGMSPGFKSGEFVASRVLLENLIPGDEIEFRFLNANLGLNCTGGLWEIASVEVKGLFVPEPAGLSWAAAGTALMVAGAVRGRRKGPAPGSPVTISPRVPA